jgi:hypothetical protein
LERKLNLVLKDLERRIANLEKRVEKIPDPFVLYYKPPGEDDYQKINHALDMLYAKINMLETMVYDG